ncbi:NAD-dependent epimerase/dehydratase family protein [Nocardioides marmoriginsengisoli]|uniref:NAD-dependent epimerase/dehydratase family protein n=1 Tax=Nocardioides marmoriginsengisoli TaxID=661483 RepID=UPI00161BB59E|nr:NAD-dependent epimerase/dehydratase family protein [Nocardioides marmoriginsengisoli]
MKVLVTGGSGVFGRTICRDLVRQGADVVAYARRPVDLPGVTSVAGDIRDRELLTRAMAGCDRVVHLAFVLAPLRSSTGVEEINLGGTENVLRAMADNGVGKLVFTSSTLAYGPWPDNPDVVSEDQPLRPHPEVMYAKHKALCEELITGSGVPAVITRTCVVAGRDMDNYEFRFLAHPALSAPTGPMKSWQFLHTDDVGRFHALATLNDRTGIVNVGPEDRGVSIDEIAEILRKPLVRLPFPVLKGVAGAAWRADVLELSPADLDGFRYMPTLDTRRMVEEWGYRPVYDSRAALEDAVPGVRAVTYLGTAKVPTPWRTPAPDHQWTVRAAGAGHDLVDPAPAGLRGEFDDLVDPRFPTLTTANVGEAFGGTLTPMSLWVSRDAMRVAGAAQVELLGMKDPDLVAAQRSLAIAAVGHRLYTNVSVVHAMADAMPGTSPREVDEHVLGIAHDDAAEPRVRAGAGETLRQLRSLPGVGLRMAGVERRIAELEDRIARRALTPDELQALSDDALVSLVDSCREHVIDAWTYSTTTNLVASAAQTLVRKVAPGLGLAALRGGTDGLASAALLQGVQALAAQVRTSPELERALRADASAVLVEDLGSIDPGFAAAFARVLDRAGHRGPGETELANRMYGDEPRRLLDSVLRAAGIPARDAGVVQDPPRRARPALAALGRAVRRRERTKDVAMRATHALRLALREIGRRQVAAGVLGAEDDVFYLIPEEIASPRLHAGKIAARRAERERLAALQLPSLFTSRWEPVATVDDRTEQVTGLGVSAGTATGPVQILRDGDDDLEPGAVLVTRVTDVGWTALFGSAAAVVTDVGGLHSHAAVVAREFGIPCVVATENATRALKDGQVVLVDGDAGTVTAL